MGPHPPKYARRPIKVGSNLRRLPPRCLLSCCSREALGLVRRPHYLDRNPPPQKLWVVHCLRMIRPALLGDLPSADIALDLGRRRLWSRGRYVHLRPPRRDHKATLNSVAGGSAAFPSASALGGSSWSQPATLALGAVLVSPAARTWLATQTHANSLSSSAAEFCLPRDLAAGFFEAASALVASAAARRWFSLSRRASSSLRAAGEIV